MSSQDRLLLQRERRASLHPRTRHWADSPVIGLKCPYSLTAIQKSPTSVIHVTEGAHKHLDVCKPLERKNLPGLELKTRVEGPPLLGVSPFQVYNWALALIVHSAHSLELELYHENVNRVCDATGSQSNCKWCINDYSQG